MKKVLISFLITSTALLAGINLAQAHAVVSPSQAGVAAFTNFSLSVPSELPMTTIAVKLLIPDGLNFITPNVKPGWKISTKTAPAQGTAPDGDPETSRITEIDWTGGQIPADLKDTFEFSAQVPTQPTTLAWKVYQTYQDGSVVSWDQDPDKPQAAGASGQSDFSKTGPYSRTMVINDLGNNGTTNSASANTSAAAKSAASNSTIDYIALALSVLAAILAFLALAKKPQQ